MAFFAVLILKDNPYRKNREEALSGLISGRLPCGESRDVCLPDLCQRVVDGAFFRFALMLLEVRLELLLGLVRVGYKFTLRAEGQFADIAIGSAGSAANKSDDDELAVRHRDIMAGGAPIVKW